jgi:hypothetical protein
MGDRENKGKKETLRAPIMCSGAMVFFESCSQISLASDEIRCMNSRKDWKEKKEGKPRPRISFAGERVIGNVCTRTDAAFDDQVARLLGAAHVVREEF